MAPATTTPLPIPSTRYIKGCSPHCTHHCLATSEQLEQPLCVPKQPHLLLLLPLPSPPPPPLCPLLTLLLLALPPPPHPTPTILPRLPASNKQVHQGVQPAAPRLHREPLVLRLHRRHRGTAGGCVGDGSAVTQECPRGWGMDLGPGHGVLGTGQVPAMWSRHATATQMFRCCCCCWHMHSLTLSTHRCRQVPADLTMLPPTHPTMLLLGHVHNHHPRAA